MVPGIIVNTLAAVNVLEETVVFARAAARAPEEALARRDADRLHEPVDSQQPSLSHVSLQLAAAAQPPSRALPAVRAYTTATFINMYKRSLCRTAKLLNS